MNLLCTSWQHFSKNFALRGNSNSNNYGGGYGNGDTVGERGKGSNPHQEITSKHQGRTLFSGTFLSRLASGPDLPHYSDPLALNHFGST